MPVTRVARPYAITMWEFSWIERRWPGAGYEDWDQALDELVERGYDAVRIDAFPHLIGVDPNGSFIIESDGQDGDWGAPGDVEIVRPGPALVEFIAKCRDRGVMVGLSTWYKRDRDNVRMRIRNEADQARVWADTLRIVSDAGLLDAIVLFSAPQSPQVQRLLRANDIQLMDFGQAEAYTRRFPFLSAVTLPRGVVDLSKDLPLHDVSLLAATTSLLSRDETHPALRQLFAQAAQTVHSDAGWFNRARDFPNTRTSELPVSPEGDRAINGTPPFWQRYLPFWASNLVERMWLVLGGMLVLMLPLSRVIPPLYQFRVRRRVFRWYARLRDIEAKVDAGQSQAERDKLLEELDALDRVVNKVAVPLSYADELYALRNNIYAVRKRALAGSASAATAAPVRSAT